MQPKEGEEEKKKPNNRSHKYKCENGFVSGDNGNMIFSFFVVIISSMFGDLSSSGNMAKLTGKRGKKIEPCGYFAST